MDKKYYEKIDGWLDGIEKYMDGGWIKKYEKMDGWMDIKKYEKKMVG